ncbi:transaldolase [Motilimonas cestriensis]|uniref:Transaldolase n=1 Tax=Motilimonas cestriensis TaxID=2742685 RepID=A0ABS8WA43_9GAMM|nr:transaldolase [Motilimonas cestriensis]MCE2595882.1 transaldolase [Motilimonas cestriensis]
MTNLLTQLKKITSVVADTGDFEAIKQHQPEDATTNPSLLLKAAQLPQYQNHIKSAIEEAKSLTDDPKQQVIEASDRLAVKIGAEILAVIPGKVSTEVDARLSFDTTKTIEKAEKLINLYQQAGIDKSRILIKIAATWQGIRAAEKLQQQGINCNLTLLFNFAQARACAEAGVFLISPFVGRILDWHKANQPEQDFSGVNDPGVISVSNIYRYYKQHGYSTVVMGASFRNTDEIIALAGCDKLTIGPDLLEQLSLQQGELVRQLAADVAVTPAPTPLSESEFLWLFHQDPMAVEKLAQGIRAFAQDQEKLETLLLSIS